MFEVPEYLFVNKQVRGQLHGTGVQVQARLIPAQGRSELLPFSRLPMPKPRPGEVTI
jgi:hypothetical protein